MKNFKKAYSIIFSLTLFFCLSCSDDESEGGQIDIPDGNVNIETLAEDILGTWEITSSIENGVEEINSSTCLTRVIIGVSEITVLDFEGTNNSNCTLTDASVFIYMVNQGTTTLGGANAEDSLVLEFVDVTQNTLTLLEDDGELITVLTRVSEPSLNNNNFSASPENVEGTWRLVAETEVGVNTFDLSGCEFVQLDITPITINIIESELDAGQTTCTENSTGELSYSINPDIDSVGETLGSRLEVPGVISSFIYEVSDDILIFTRINQNGEQGRLDDAVIFERVN